MNYKLPKFKEWVDQPVRWVSPKADGHLQYVCVDEQRKIMVLTKNLKDNTAKLLSVEHIRKELRCLPCDSFVIGECHWPGHLATEVPHMLCTGDSRLKFSVFAAPLLGGKDLTNSNLMVAMYIIEALGLDIIVAKEISAQMNRDFLLKEAIKQKIEGWVLKNSHMDEWYKLKPVKTIDAFVLDVTESDSETYKGYMKALILGLHKPDGSVHELGECGGGFTKAFKLSMPYDEMKESLVGPLHQIPIRSRVCEVAYDSVTKHRKLRFPRFVRWRDDKDTTACTTEQLI